MQGGALAASQGVTFQGGGQFQWTSGTLHTNVWTGNLTNSAGTLAPGRSAGSTTIIGNYTQQASAAMQIEIGGTAASTQHDFVNVTGTALVGGQLNLALIGGFVPSATDTFTVLNAASLLSFFSNVGGSQRLATADGGGSFLVHYGPTSPFNPNQVRLTDFQRTFLAADFNEDGNVDGDDLTRWRNNFGTGTTHMQGDADGDGDADGADFLVWQRQLGSPPSAVAANAPIPEPATSLLFIVAAVGIRRMGRRTRQELDNG